MLDNTQQIAKYTEALIGRGYHGATLTIKLAGRTEFLQFRKEIKAPSDTTIRSDFPMMLWSEKYRESLIQYLHLSGVAHAVTAGAADIQVDGLQPTETVTLRFAADSLQLYQYVEWAIDSLFKHQQGDSIDIELLGIAAFRQRH